jgi:hypothetical protein
VLEDLVIGGVHGHEAERTNSSALEAH